MLKAVANGGRRVPLGRKRVPGEFAGLPWGTLVTLLAGSEEFALAVGPVCYERGEWMLPRFPTGDADPAPDVHTLRRQTARLRRLYGLD